MPRRPRRPASRRPMLVAALSDPDAIDEDPTFTGGSAGALLHVEPRGRPRHLDVPARDRRRSVAAARRGSASSTRSTRTGRPPCRSTGCASGSRATATASPRGQIWQATRASRAAAWDPPAPVAELASGSVDFAPAVDATETTMYLSSDRANAGGTVGGADFDIYASTRTGTGRAVGLAGAGPGRRQQRRRIRSVRGAGRAGRVLHVDAVGDGRHLLVVAPLAGGAVRGARGLSTISTRTRTTRTTTLSPDLGTLMFSSTRSGNAEIYEATALR